jgi:hypothetical protein
MFCYAYSVFIVLFYVLFVCKRVLYYCYRVSTQLQLTNIYHIISQPIDMESWEDDVTLCLFKTLIFQMDIS